jgi:hypothetical protein
MDRFLGPKIIFQSRIVVVHSQDFRSGNKIIKHVNPAVATHETLTVYASPTPYQSF